MEDWDDDMMREIYILHLLGYKIWEIMNLTIAEKNLILKSYYVSSQPKKPQNLNTLKKHRDVFLAKLKRKMEVSD
jgi:hypothetical protein